MMKIEIPFFRLTVVVFLMKTFLSSLAALFELPWTVAENVWQKHSVSSGDSRCPFQFQDSRLGQSKLNAEFGFANLDVPMEHRYPAFLPLPHEKSTCRENEEK